VLVVADTRSNRDVVRIARGEFLAVFPADARNTWSALGDGLPPTDDGIVLV
jgi:hypothetical protein